MWLVAAIIVRYMQAGWMTYTLKVKVTKFCDFLSTGSFDVLWGDEGWLTHMGSQNIVSLKNSLSFYAYIYSFRNSVYAQSKINSNLSLKVIYPVAIPTTWFLFSCKVDLVIFLTENFAIIIVFLEKAAYWEHCHPINAMTCPNART